MTITLVTHNSAYGRYLASGLVAAGAVDRVIVEHGRPSRKFYWKKLKAVGPVNFVFQYWLNRWFRRRGAELLPDSQMPDHLPIENINRQEFAADELLLGFGTTYVTRKTLNRAPLGFLNLHTGVLPDYRGVKSEFWCLKARDYANLGWTLHFMTPRLDEGDIVQIGRVPFENEDPAALRVKLIRDALPALVGWLRQVKTVGMSALPRVPQIGGAYYTTPTLREWRRYRTHRPGDTGNA